MVLFPLLPLPQLLKVPLEQVQVLVLVSFQATIQAFPMEPTLLNLLVPLQSRVVRAFSFKLSPFSLVSQMALTPPPLFQILFSLQATLVEFLPQFSSLRSVEYLVEDQFRLLLDALRFQEIFFSMPVQGVPFLLVQEQAIQMELHPQLVQTPAQAKMGLQGCQVLDHHLLSLQYSASPLMITASDLASAGIQPVTLQYFFSKASVHHCFSPQRAVDMFLKWESCAHLIHLLLVKLLMSLCQAF